MYPASGTGGPRIATRPAGRASLSAILPALALARRLVSSNVPMVSTAARILVADDQPDVLEALRWLLTGEGYDAELVDSTDAVIDRLGAGTFDLVLMDL